MPEDEMSQAARSCSIWRMWWSIGDIEASASSFHPSNLVALARHAVATGGLVAAEAIPR